jgi:branched-chain amino acid transport system substrate-binding protein
MVTDERIANNGWRVFHRTLASHEVDVAAGIRHLTGPLKATKVFVVGDAVDGVQAATESVTQVTRVLGARVAGTGTLASSADATGLVEQIRASGADAVYFTGWYATGVALVKQLRAAKLTVPLMGSQRLFSQSYVTQAGNSVAAGTYITCPCTGEDVGSFETAYKAKFALAAPFFGPEAFDAATILLAGLAAGKTTRADLLSWVEAYDSPGLARHIRFTDEGDLDPAEANAWLFRVNNDGLFASEGAIPDP